MFAGCVCRLFTALPSGSLNSQSIDQNLNYFQTGKRRPLSFLKILKIKPRRQQNVVIIPE